MIVVGGVYSERVSYPPTDELFGSGLKAAAALSSLSRVTLIACVSRKELPAAISASKTYGFKYRFTPRPHPISFSYVTPLTKPLILGLPKSTIPISAFGNAVLAFGMVESSQIIRAQRLTIDPQSPTEAALSQFRGHKAKHLAIVLNRQEAIRIGKTNDLRKAGRNIQKRASASVVVIKHGALGVLVLDRSKSSWIGVHPTRSVWPIGSGDVFSGVFAWAWGERKFSPLKAAILASAGTAAWCSTRVIPLAKDFHKHINKLSPAILIKQPPRVYIAGPFFSASQVWLLEVVKGALENLGAKTFSPLHHVGRGEDEVAAKDLAGLKKCSSVLALLVEEDAGTLFEVGYARANKIPVIGFAAAHKSSKFKMLRGTGIKMYPELSTAIYRAIWECR